jgi:plastocyanin
MNRFRIAVLAAVVAAAAVLVPTTDATIHQISVANFAFTPPTVNAVLGDTLRWVWVSGTHTATSGDPSTCTPDGIFNGPLDSAHHTFDYVATQVGTIPYYCFFHCAMGMNGSIIVSQPTAVPEAPPAESASARWLAASPNPFLSTTTVRLRLPQPAAIRVEIFDVAGRSIQVLADRLLDAGTHELAWDARTARGGAAPGGVYYARLLSQERTESVRLLLLR